MKRTPAESAVRNVIGWRQRLSRLRGDAVRFDLRAYDAPLAEVNTLEERLRKCRDSELAALGAEIRAAAAAALPRQSVRPRAYALVREAARRTLGLRPFDVQIVAALAMDDGAVVEMQTGEGKTLAAVMPAALNALTGRGVHVLTFNDYLAERDAAWMGPVYGALGLTARHVQQGMTPAARREAYAADVTYVTAKEAGFDHLRDLLAVDPRDIVHRPFHFAILDEADSLMIDEARVPLVIAGSVDRVDSSAASLAALVRSLERGVHFDTDEYERDVELTDEGTAHVEKALGCGNLHDEKNYRLLTGLNCALHALVLLRRDVDYIVRSGRIELVDEFTGRVVDDRHWPDGLQAALEAKEGIRRSSDGCVLDSLTLQHFLRGYPRVCGMTGTARDAAWELQQTYGVEVVVIPTNRPAIRIDQPDVVFTHREAKERAVVDEIRRAATSGRPVLVGTFTIEESERLAAHVRSAGLACEVLNARNDAAEARIVAKAGAPGAITIATNMAGRGTDVRLGGEDEAEHDRVAALGGLYVIGTNRHESHRVDLQLRGRAGRQGDPGESRFFLSLDDDLMVKFGVRNLIPQRFIPTRVGCTNRQPCRSARGCAHAANHRGSEHRDPPDTWPIRGGHREAAHAGDGATHRPSRRSRSSGRVEGQRKARRARGRGGNRGGRRRRTRRHAPSHRSGMAGASRILRRPARRDSPRPARRPRSAHAILGGSDPIVCLVRRGSRRGSPGRSGTCLPQRRVDRPDANRHQRAVIHLDVSRQRRSIPQPDWRDADRPRRQDGRHILGGGNDAAVDRVGARRQVVRTTGATTLIMSRALEGLLHWRGGGPHNRLHRRPKYRGRETFVSESPFSKCLTPSQGPGRLGPPQHQKGILMIKKMALFMAHFLALPVLAAAQDVNTVKSDACSRQHRRDRVGELEAVRNP